MSYFRITLHRSGIGLPKRTRGVLAALGLRKRCQTVFHPVTPDSAGMIMKVKELVAVREVAEPLTTRQLRDERRPEPGFWVERAVPR
ncbi:ribosomal protein L30p/L7e-domain-containing protein [Nemania sp. NC0429]|nr:ribosomal protein L30p/L7e-domain-containing protein [Nemania sp. NC0429]